MEFLTVFASYSALSVLTTNSEIVMSLMWCAIPKLAVSASASFLVSSSLLKSCWIFSQISMMLSKVLFLNKIQNSSPPKRNGRAVPQLVVSILANSIRHKSPITCLRLSLMDLKLSILTILLLNKFQ